MNLQIPNFVPVPSAEIILTISIAALIAGICFIGAGFFFLFLNKRKGREKKNTFIWILIGIGVLLIVNHGMQLLF